MAKKKRGQLSIGEVEKLIKLRFAIVSLLKANDKLSKRKKALSKTVTTEFEDSVLYGFYVAMADAKARLRKGTNMLDRSLRTLEKYCYFTLEGQGKASRRKKVK